MAFKDFVKTVKSEAGDAVEVTKLKANIKETYEAIGEIFYNKVKEGAQMDPEFSPLVEKIDAAKESIKNCNDEIDHVKMN